MCNAYSHEVGLRCPIMFNWLISAKGYTISHHQQQFTSLQTAIKIFNVDSDPLELCF